MENGSGGQVGVRNRECCEGDQEAHWPCRDTDFAMTWAMYGLSHNHFEPRDPLYVLVGPTGGTI